MLREPEGGDSLPDGDSERGETDRVVDQVVCVGVHVRVARDSVRDAVGEPPESVVVNVEGE